MYVRLPRCFLLRFLHTHTYTYAFVSYFAFFVDKISVLSHISVVNKCFLNSVGWNYMHMNTLLYIFYACLLAMGVDRPIVIILFSYRIGNCVFVCGWVNTSKNQIVNYKYMFVCMCVRVSHCINAFESVLKCSCSSVP